MNCLSLHDSMQELFGDVDSTQYSRALSDAYGNDDWKPLLGDNPERDQAILHISECTDCRYDLESYLSIRDKVNYKDFPCIHLAEHSMPGEGRCIEDDRGTFSILAEGKDFVGICIGHCPWCGIPLPTSHAEESEIEEMGLRKWQYRRMNLNKEAHEVADASHDL